MIFGGGVLKGQKGSFVPRPLGSGKKSETPADAAKCFDCSRSAVLRAAEGTGQTQLGSSAEQKSISVSPKLRILKATGRWRLAP